MASISEVRATLNVLCRYYRDKNNEPRQLDDVQVTVYTAGLHKFDAEQLEACALAWMQKSKWFPALSDLLAEIDPAVDWEALAAIAWTTFERAIGMAGIYRGVTFEDPAIGEAVRQTFGSWEHACSYDRDSPGWAIRRQTFLAVFPSLAARATEPVTLRGLSPVDRPVVIAHVPLLPEPARLLKQIDKSASVYAEIQRRFKALREATVKS